MAAPGPSATAYAARIAGDNAWSDTWKNRYHLQARLAQQEELEKRAKSYNTLPAGTSNSVTKNHLQSLDTANAFFASASKEHAERLERLQLMIGEVNKHLSDAPPPTDMQNLRRELRLLLDSSWEFYRPEEMEGLEYETLQREVTIDGDLTPANDDELLEMQLLFQDDESESWPIRRVWTAIQQLNRRAVDLASKNEDLNREVISAKDRRVWQEDLHKRDVEEKRKLRVDIEKLQSNLATAQVAANQLKTYKDSRERNVARLKDAQDEVRSLQENVRSLQEEKSALETSKEKLAREIKTSKSAYKKQCADLRKACSEDVKAAEEATDILQEQYDQAQEEIANLQSRISGDANLSTLLETSREMGQKARDILARVRGERDHLREVECELQTECTSKSERIIELETESADLSGELDTSKSELIAVNRLASDRQTEIENLRSAASDAQDDIANLQESNRTVDAQLRLANDQNAKLSVTCQQQKLDLQEANRIKAEVEEELKTSKADCELALKKVTMLTSSKAEVQQDLTTLQEQMSNLQQSAQILQLQVPDQNKTVSVAREEYTKLLEARDALDRLQLTHELEKTAHGSLKSRARSVESRAAELDTEATKAKEHLQLICQHFSSQPGITLQELSVRLVSDLDFASSYRDSVVAPTRVDTATLNWDIYLAPGDLVLQSEAGLSPPRTACRQLWHQSCLQDPPPKLLAMIELVLHRDLPGRVSDTDTGLLFCATQRTVFALSAECQSLQEPQDVAFACLQALRMVELLLRVQSTCQTSNFGLRSNFRSLHSFLQPLVDGVAAAHNRLQVEKSFASVLLSWLRAAIDPANSEPSVTFKDSMTTSMQVYGNSDMTIGVDGVFFVLFEAGERQHFTVHLLQTVSWHFDLSFVTFQLLSDEKRRGMGETLKSVPTGTVTIDLDNGLQWAETHLAHRRKP